MSQSEPLRFYLVALSSSVNESPTASDFSPTDTAIPNAASILAACDRMPFLSPLYRTLAERLVSVVAKTGIETPIPRKIPSLMQRSLASPSSPSKIACGKSSRHRARASIRFPIEVTRRAAELLNGGRG